MGDQSAEVRLKEIVRKMISGGAPAQAVFRLVGKRDSDADKALVALLAEDPKLRERLTGKLRLMIHDNEFRPATFGEINATRSGDDLLGDIGCERHTPDAQRLHEVLSQAPIVERSPETTVQVKAPVHVELGAPQRLRAFGA